MTPIASEETRLDEDAWELALFATEFPQVEPAAPEEHAPREAQQGETMAPGLDAKSNSSVAESVWGSHPATAKTGPHSLTRSKHPRRRRPFQRLARSRILTWALVIAVIGAGSLLIIRTGYDLSRQLHDARGLLASSRTETKASIDRARGLTSQLEAAQSAQREQANIFLSQASALQAELDRLKASKTKTVVRTKTVTKTETKWVPSGTSVAVETIGFVGMIEIHDVQITQAFGFSDLVGIAINSTGGTVSYAELGCTFLDAQGKVLANAIVNRTDWAAGASWGFDCSAQVTATGGILRVNQMG